MPGGARLAGAGPVQGCLDVGCVALSLGPLHSAYWGSTDWGWALAGGTGRGIPERSDS